MKVVSEVRIVPGEVVRDGMTISTMPLNELYREFVKDYPKFFKMDGLCNLGFLASEFLLGGIASEEKENGAVVLFNRSGSLATDRNYQLTIGEDNYFPSPALFVYTLANIVTGEIAIRHKIYGETSFYVLADKDEELIDKTINNIFLTSHPSFVMAGWVEYVSDKDYTAEIKLIKNK